VDIKGQNPTAAEAADGDVEVNGHQADCKEAQQPNEEDEMAAEQHPDPYGDGQEEPFPRPPALRIENQ